MKRIFFLLLLLTQLFACSAEVGSKEWCDDLEAKPKSDWSTNDAADYARHCLFE